MIIETKQLIISEELKRKVELICRFANAKYTLINGNIKSIKNTNIAYVRPHILRVKETDSLMFEECYRFVETVTYYAIGKANMN